ncbi:hypothetical protein CBR_g20200 [Chara braunii]|uniref:FAS1 domain-containing protein n=1 Tax=Chara braunii TaxID=69332 RepID=A0A388KZT2_CHABU|nr:hypothetical protein CBR_g20200 [Chara braunii]|eukprot:GBG75569.1 hypothetical protein CBR_g20200 [Chara braunii]
MAAAVSVCTATLAILLLLAPFSGAAEVDTSAGDALIGAITNHCCLKKFYYALQISRVESRLRDSVNQGPITVFAPTDDSFMKLDPELWRCVTTGQGPLDILSQIMLYHFVTDGNFTAAELATKTQLTSASGMPIGVKVVNGKVVLEDYAPITGPDALRTSNATVHLIGELLVPATIVSTIENVCRGGPPSASLPTPGISIGFNRKEQLAWVGRCTSKISVGFFRLPFHATFGEHVMAITVPRNGFPGLATPSQVIHTCREEREG